MLVSLHRLNEAQLGMERFEQDNVLRATVQQSQHDSCTHSNEQCRCSRLVWPGAAGGVHGTAEPELHVLRQ